MLASAAQTILSYCQTFIWPAVTTGLVLFFLIRFHHNIANLLDRITEARGPAGMGVSAAPPPSQDVAPIDDDAVIGLDVLQGVVEDYEQQLQDAQQAHQQNVEQLVQDVTVARLELDFERTYRLSLGSQIRALHALRDLHPSSVPRSLVEPIFDAAKSQASVALASWTFEQWMSFMLRDGYAGPLVEQLGDGTYRITAKGQAFLGYVGSNNYPPKLF